MRLFVSTGWFCIMLAFFTLWPIRAYASSKNSLADINRDGAIDMLDMNIITNNFGIANPLGEAALSDIDQNGTIELADLVVVGGCMTSLTSTCQIADVDNDIDVDSSDLAILQGYLGQTDTSTNMHADLNGNGIINNADVTILTSVLNCVWIDVTLASYSVPLASSNPTFTGTASSVVQGTDGTISGVTYSLNSGSWTTSGIQAVDGGFNSYSESFSLTFPENLSEGNHTLQIKTTLSKGTVSQINNYTLVVDSYAPTITLNPLDDDPTSDTTPSVTGRATDATGNVASVHYRMDDAGVWTACESVDGGFTEPEEAFVCTVATPLASGSHTMYVKATDSYSNSTAPGAEASDSFSVMVVVDEPSPTPLSSPTPSPNPSPTPSASPTPSPLAQSDTLSSPHCADQIPVFAPDLFEINTTCSTAKLFFTPIANTATFVVSFSTKREAEEHGETVTLAKEGVQSHTIYQLKPNTTYYFKIRGQNGCMPGPWSNILPGTTCSYKTNNSTLAFFHYNSKGNN